jgi:hypothetical protein
MAKQSKKPADLNRLAAAIVGDATEPQGKKKRATKKSDAVPAAKPRRNSR